jgi:GT2 family glycosyltransferase
MKSLGIVIVNWNAGRQLQDCISSVRNARQECFVLSVVVIVDNGSEDHSLNGVEKLGVPLKVICNTENRGFAAACNQGAAAITGDYLLFLNPDTRLFEKSLLEPLAFMTQPENSHVGICGIQLIDESDKECLSYAKVPTLGGFINQAVGINKILDGDRKEGGKGSSEDSGILEVDQVIGAFFVVRRTVFEQLQGFDERFFVYFEEVDFSLRARRAGYQMHTCRRRDIATGQGGAPVLFTAKQIAVWL